jgi:hypothetical protein
MHAARRRRPPAGRPAWLIAALLVILIAVAGAITLAGGILQPAPTAETLLELTPQAELDRSWGSYLSEREWGTPREAIGANGWGLSWRGAIDTEYHYSDDGIAGMTDQANEFRLGWAFWDGAAEHVTERFAGTTNPQGDAGETIADDRVFDENTPTHAYQRLTYGYPPGESPDGGWFRIQLEAAKFNSTHMTLVAMATNTSTEARPLDIIFKAWLAPGGVVDPLADGLLLRGSTSAVAVTGPPPDQWQISADKAALDENVRNGGLTGNGGGHIGALAYHFEIAAGATSTVRIGMAQLPSTAPGADESAAPEVDGAAARAAAGTVRDQSSAIVRTRREETSLLFTGEVTAHEELYRQALMSLLWNESFYRWDGTSGVNQKWAGRVDAHDVLIMPDKWEFPWLASWDSGFHAVTAALVDPLLAQDQLRFLLSDRWQQPDGHIPCGEWVMDQECPPIFAWAVWRVYEASHDTTFLEEVYPGLQANYDYWWQNNQVGDALFSGGFLGMDNLPRAGGQPQADGTAWMAFFARDMANIASELRDPQTSARYWVDRGLIQDAINASLWDEESGFYYDMAAPERLVGQKSYSGLIPLIAGVVPPARVPRVLAALRDEDQLMSVGGIRSLSAEAPLYTPGTAGRGVNSNWRGPVWLPINYLLVQELSDIDPGLATDLRERLVNMVELDWQQTGRFHEFFDGDTGAGLGADEQAGWTALVANLIREGWPAQ